MEIKSLSSFIWCPETEFNLKGRTRASLKRLMMENKITIGERIYSVMIGGLARNSFKRTCQQCGAKCFIQIGAMARGRANVCSQSCGAILSGKARSGPTHPLFKGGSKEQNKRYKNKHPLKVKCRTETRKALRHGLLIASPCNVCGDQKSEIHHRDYSKPLEVEWLCRNHHMEKRRTERDKITGLFIPPKS